MRQAGVIFARKTGFLCLSFRAKNETPRLHVRERSSTPRPNPTHQTSFLVNTNNLVSLLSHDEVNHYLASGLGAAYGLEVQMRLLKEGLPYDECQCGYDNR